MIVPVNGISLNNPSIKLAKGTDESLTVTFLPPDATDKVAVWTSSNESVATVDSSGKVTAVNVGSTIITATSHDGGFTASCNVTVVIPVTGVTLDKSTLTLNRGTTEKLNSTVNPSDATDQVVTCRREREDS